MAPATIRFGSRTRSSTSCAFVRSTTATATASATFRGLTEKLDYFNELGVTTLWLLPFYPSPMQDDGYDTADYLDVHPDCGTAARLQRVPKEAHRRGSSRGDRAGLEPHLRPAPVVSTGAARAQPGSQQRDFYVWSDTAERYKEARIIFKDFEHSNWTWDPVAKAYYWHRFYAHQPDLNFDNPAVKKALLKVVDFWFGLGVDGLRLDAVPYLYEREGTNCENLPETHAFLSELRRHVDRKLQEQMLLAEANQWPEDAVAYFDQRQGLPHGVSLSDHASHVHGGAHRGPVSAHRHLGANAAASRHVASGPLLAQPRRAHARDGDRRRARLHVPRLRARKPDAHQPRHPAQARAAARQQPAHHRAMNALLFSLPGTPFIYYGDEIGMGDNVYLGDRDGVRTPMQWSGDRNAGFSRANPQRLILPVIIDHEYHYQTVNVEAQEQNRHSLLWWMRRLIALRKQFRAFGRGTHRFLAPRQPAASSPSCGATRTSTSSSWPTCRASCSTWSSTSRSFKGAVPIELFGRTQLPPGGRSALLSDARIARLLLVRAGADARGARVRAGLSTAEAGARNRLEGHLLGESRDCSEGMIPHYLLHCAWFGGRTRHVKSAKIVETLPVGEGLEGPCLNVIEVEYGEGEPELYLLPLSFLTDDAAHQAKNARRNGSSRSSRSWSGGSPRTAWSATPSATWSSPRMLLDFVERRRSGKGR